MQICAALAKPSACGAEAAYSLRGGVQWPAGSTSKGSLLIRRRPVTPTDFAGRRAHGAQRILGGRQQAVLRIAVAAKPRPAEPLARAVAW